MSRHGVPRGWRAASNAANRAEYRLAELEVASAHLAKASYVCPQCRKQINASRAGLRQHYRNHRGNK